jgi:hypothetical protein
MRTGNDKPDIGARAVDTSRLDLTQLVGKPVKFFSKQFPGKTINSKCVSAGTRRILVNSSGSTDPLMNLVNHQKVVIQFPYKGQSLSVNAWLKRSDGGRCYFEFDTKVAPLSQRRFLRISREFLVKLAALSVRAHYRQNLANLRWVESNTCNFSSGGMLLSISSYLEPGATLLMNIDVNDNLFPPLVLGRVKYCYQDDDSGFKAGIEFMVKETAGKLVPPPILRLLPNSVQSYTVTARERLNRKFQVMRPWSEQPNRSKA